VFEFFNRFGSQKDTQEGPPEGGVRIGYLSHLLDAAQIASLLSQFPNLSFDSLGSEWSDPDQAGFDIVLVDVDSESEGDVGTVIRRIRACPSSTRTVVVLKNATVQQTRVLARCGAADVLPAPLSPAALALSLERLLSSSRTVATNHRKSGKLVALLKAGGGVGATSIGVQATQMIAARGGDRLHTCFADLDLQYGVGALYFDLGDALSISDCLGERVNLAETDLIAAITRHNSGAHVLAGPRDLTPLEVMTNQTVDVLLTGFRRDFDLAIIDLPSVWTAWTNRVLQLVDRIVLVTHLTVPHIHLVRRQLAVLAIQHLDTVPTSLVANAVTPGQLASLSVKTAEQTLGREFAAIVPYDPRTMDTACNEGIAISAVSRNTKMEQEIKKIARIITSDVHLRTPSNVGTN
jgi:pilus assembly protein CpaE